MKEYVYFDFNQQFNNCIYQFLLMFLMLEYGNVGYYVVGMGLDKFFLCLMLNVIFDFVFWGLSNG